MKLTIFIVFLPLGHGQFSAMTVGQIRSHGRRF